MAPLFADGLWIISSILFFVAAAFYYLVLVPLWKFVFMPPLQAVCNSAAAQAIRQHFQRSRRAYRRLAIVAIAGGIGCVVFLVVGLVVSIVIENAMIAESNEKMKGEWKVDLDPAAPLDSDTLGYMPTRFILNADHSFRMTVRHRDGDESVVRGHWGVSHPRASERRLHLTFSNGRRDIGGRMKFKTRDCFLLRYDDESCDMAVRVRRAK